MRLARGLQWTAWGLVVLLAIRLARFIVRSVEGNAYDFAQYYTAARLAWQRAPGEYLYDGRWFAQRGIELTGIAASPFDANPPTTALLLIPFIGLPFTWAHLAWAVITVVCLVSAVAMLAKGLALRGSVLAGFSALVLLYQPLFANIRAGQVYVLLLALLVVAWRGYRRGAQTRLGFALGCLAAFKLAAALLWVLLLAQRRWKALAWAATTVVALGLSSVILLGPWAWPTYVASLPELTTRPGTLLTAFQSLPGFVRHLTIADPRLNPEPLFPAPALAPWVLGAALVAMLAVSLSVTLRAPPADLAFAVFAAASTVINPQSLDYHYVLLLLPIAILLAWARNQGRTPAPILVGIATFLIAADVQSRSLEMGRGSPALLAYPKLYGAMILWGTAVWACHQRPRRIGQVHGPAEEVDAPVRASDDRESGEDRSRRTTRS